MSWRPIRDFPLPDPGDYGDCVLVYNGERVGEAHCEETWDRDSDDQVWKWAWTHHSTCSCCFSFMDPQPILWQPLPEIPHHLHTAGVEGLIP